MASAFGWFGPLIDLSRASSHIGDFVQLLVFVHRSFPVQVSYSPLSLSLYSIPPSFTVNLIASFLSHHQCKFSKRDITRTDIEVGDDTTPYFLVSLWQKNMASIVAAGDVVLLQSKFRFFQTCIVSAEMAALTNAGCTRGRFQDCEIWRRC